MSILTNVRYAIRGMRRSPGFAVGFILTLGLGIGANTAIFSIINGVLLKPLPYPNAERIMYLRQPATLAGVPNVSFSFVEVADYRSQSSSVEEFVEFGDWTFNVVGQGDPHRAQGGLVTSNFFDVLGMRPVLGRTLQKEDDDRAAAPVAVLTNEYWTRVFGRDSSVLGRTIKLTNKSVTIVGVLEPGSHYASQQRQDFYVNYPANDHYMGASMQDERRHRMTDVFARLTPTATVDQAQAELRGIADRLHEEYPEAYPTARGFDLTVTPWLDALTQNARTTLLLLFGTVVVVLVIACANVANLTLTRLMRRERELAIRTALGADEARIRAQILTENLLLALAGAALGVVVAKTGLHLLVSYTERFTLRIGEINIDGWVLGFTLAVAIGAAVALAWIPGRRLTRGPAGSLMAAGSQRTIGGMRHRRMQRALVVGQLGMSFVLLMAAGLLVRSLINLARVDPGFDPDGVVSLQAPNFTGLDPVRARQVLFEVLDRTRHYPGVRAAAAASWAPFRAGSPFPLDVRVEGAQSDPNDQSVRTTFNAVTPEYFQTLGVAVQRGRTFTAQDDANGEHVVILNATMATRLFGTDDPVGRRIEWSFGNNQWQPATTVIGVVADTKEFGLDDSGTAVIYQSAFQSFPGWTFLVRTNGEPGPLVQHVTDVIRELDPERPVDNIFTLDELRAEHVAPWRLNATLFGSFALLALVIAAIGVGGVLAVSVSQRTNEFGVRMTFGANQVRILRMVLGEGVTMSIIGIVLGAVGAVFVTRLMTSLLFAVEPVDVTTMVGVIGILTLVAIGSSLIPAYRASRVDPMEALRSD